MSTPASPTPDKRVGVREVARAAGVSTQTVSRVLNNNPQVREETRQRVLDAVAALDYRMNNAARALGTARSRMIGAIVSDADLFGPATGLAALERAARESGRWLLTSYVDAADDAAVDAAVEHLLTHGVDGLVLVGSRLHTVSRLRNGTHDLPVTTLIGDDDEGGQRTGAALVVRHLVSQGHTRIARLGGPAGWSEEGSRRAGFDDARRAAGLDDAPSWHGDWSAASGAAWADDIADAIAAPHGPTAIVVANDQMALGLIAGLSARGLRIPDDVSIVGFDDNPDAAFYTPALTSVRVDVAGAARRAVAHIAEATASTSESARTPLIAAPALIERRSSAAPR